MSTLGRLLWSFFRAPVKGALGETAVKAGAALALPSSAYRRYHDVTLPTAGGTTQIDHVFVSVFGVFVVETKNMNGWIYGRAQNREWTQVFPGGQKYRFQNPIRQNYGHVKAVEYALTGMGLPGGMVKSVIVFVGEAELKSEMPENVTVGFDAARYIRSFQNRILTEGQVAEICAAIESGRMKPSWGTDRQHIRNVQQRTGSTQRRCPRCGRKMVLRTARRGPNEGGKFWGCEGFSKCRAVQET